MDNFLSKFNALLDGHIPLRKLTQKEFKQKFKPWISKNIIGKISEKNKIFENILIAKMTFVKQNFLNNSKF